MVTLKIDEHLMQITDEGYSVLSQASLIGKQQRRDRTLKARAVKQQSEQINGRGIYVHKSELHLLLVSCSHLGG